MDNLIKNLCKEYENILNEQGKVRTVVKYVSEKKVDGYWLPQLNLKVKNIEAPPLTLAWHCEIWVNNQCIFRQSMIPKDDTEIEWDKVRRICQQQMLTSVFVYGMTGAREILKNVKIDS